MKFIELALYTGDVDVSANGTIAADSCGTKKALTLSAVNNTMIP